MANGTTFLGSALAFKDGTSVAAALITFGRSTAFSFTARYFGYTSECKINDIEYEFEGRRLKSVSELMGIGEQKTVDYIYDSNGLIIKKVLGYCYDDDTEMYYCKSRFYVPKWRRWLNSDSINYLEPQNITCLNLFAYCNNNPVMYVDENGNMPKWVGNVLKGLAIIAGTALAVTAITFTGGTGAAFIAAVGKTALIGLEIAAVSGVTSGAIRAGRSLVKNINEGNSFSKTMSNAGKSFINGFGDGFLAGGEYYLGAALLSFGGCNALGTFNNGSGLIMPNYMIGYQNPNVYGFTIFSSRKGGKFRVDLEPTRALHYHYGHTKAERKIHKGSWIGGFFVGVYVGFNGDVY